MTMSPESVAASAHSRAHSKAVKKDKQTPRSFIEFVQSTAPFAHSYHSDKLNSQVLQAVYQCPDGHVHTGQCTEALSYATPDEHLQHRPPVPGTPRLTIESPSSESDTLDRAFSQRSIDNSNDECSSYYSDSCAIEREPRRANVEHSDKIMWRKVTRPFESVNMAKSQPEASAHGSCLAPRRLSRVDARGVCNQRQAMDASCCEYDGDD
jgi:hypothetical protein